MENFFNKITDSSFVNYVCMFDVVCLTETFVGSDYNFDNMFHDYVKYVSPAKKLSAQGRRSDVIVDKELFFSFN